MYRLSNSFPYLLNRVGVRMGELFSRRIAPFGVTLPMYRVMAALWESGDQRLSDLALVTTADISTLSRLVGEMKRKGLVTRSRLKDNGRTVAINLTSKGKSLVEELMPIAVHFEDVAVSSFSEAEVLRLKVACRSPAVRGKRRYRMHGGAPGSGAPFGSSVGEPPPAAALTRKGRPAQWPSGAPPTPQFRTILSQGPADG